MATLIEQLLLTLKDHGAGEIYGIPGDYVISIFRTIQDSKILPLYTLSHEPAIGFAADGSARFNKRISVACVTYGAGALNIVNPIAGAYAERVPIVVLSGSPDYKSVSKKLRMHHELKSPEAQFEVFKNITCDQVRIDNIERAPDEISKVLESCLKHSRPVYIEISGDLYNALSEKTPLSFAEDNLYSNPQTPSLVDKTIRILQEAKNPLILLGYELERFGLEAKALKIAKSIGSNYLTCLMSRNISQVPCYKGRLGDNNISTIVTESDAILMLGAIPIDANFSPTLEEFKGKSTIFVSDNQLEINSLTYKGIHIKDFVDDLSKKTFSLTRVKHLELEEVYPSNLAETEEPISSYDIIRGINDAFAKYGKLPLAVDIGDSLISSMRIDADKILAPWFYGSMGYAVPAGLGIQTSSAQRPLILLGDGDFQMTGWELCNCRKYGLDPIVVVFNNSSWGILNAIKTEASFNSISELNYAKIAEDLGGTPYRVQTKKELKAALNKAFQTRGTFQLIEAILDCDTNNVGILSELSKIIKGR